MTKEHIDKILSGRFWLTIIAGGVFAWASVKGKINAEAISAIISMVFISYFQRQDRNGKRGEEHEETKVSQ